MAVGAAAQTKPEELAMFPTSLTMGGREERVVMVATRSGKVPARVEWTISNPAVATITPRGATAGIKATSAGRAIVTARVDGRMTSAALTVADEPDLRLGTIRWSIAPIPGLTQRPPIEASRVEDDGADLFAVDADPMKRFAVVRALTASGRLVWQATVRGTPWAGDRFGGLLVRLGPLDQPSRTLARLDRARSKVSAWRYKARGDIDDFAESDDGTIFLTVQTHPRLNVRNENSQIVVLDGKTGIEQGHFTLPASTWQTSGSCVPKGTLVRRPSELGALGEGTNGGVYAQLLVTHDTWSRVCEKGRPIRGRGRFTVSRELQLVRLTRAGLMTVRSLWRVDDAGVDSTDRLKSIEDVAPGPVVELKSGDLIALRTHLYFDASGRLAGRLHIARIAHGDVVKEVVRPGVLRLNKPWRILIDAPDTARLYFADGTTLHAIDLDTGAVAWTLDSAAMPFETIETNSVGANDTVRNQFMEVNYRGTVLRTFPTRVDDAHMVGGAEGVFHGVDPQTHALIEVQQPAYIETMWSTMLDLDTSFEEVRRRFADFLIETR
jgi:outer membrane protein assembly factor BamB